MIATLSEHENHVLHLTVETWNAFLLLPNEHPDDVDEFRHAIHRLQSLILQRPTRRQINSRQT